jgi:hypothetical protein
MKKQAIEFAGRRFASITEAAAHYGMHATTIARRLRNGWTLEQVFGLAKRKRFATYSHEVRTSRGTFSSIKAAAAEFGMNPGTVQARLAKGWTPDEAVGIVARSRSRRSTKPIVCAGEKYQSLAMLADAHDIKLKLVWRRLNLGWTPEQAVGISEPPPRFRNQVGGARERHWKKVDIVDEVEYPGADKGGYKLYIVRNDLNGKEYVGITVTPLWLRLNGHKANARKGVKGKLYNAMRRYGFDHFSITPIRNDAKNFAELQRQEIDEIEKRGTLKRGYNTSPGGQIGTPQETQVGGIRFPSRAAAAQHFGVDPSVFNLRLSRLGWTPEQAAEIEPRKKFSRRKVIVKGTEFRSLKAAAEHFGVKYQLAHERLTRKGWTLEQALGVATPPDSAKYAGRSVIAFGKTFASYGECARHFGIKAESLRQRVVNRHDTVEEAVSYLRTRPKPGPKGNR